MNILIIICTLFVIGSISGYILEVLYRRFFSRHKWVNPGFLLGPYLPIYGIGVVVLYGISNITIPIPYDWLIIIIKIIMIGVCMTLIELIIGIICVKGFHIKLWDYSKHKGNVMGVICPLYSLYWLIGGCLYYFLINPLLVDAITFISDNLIYSFFIGIVIGMIIVDFSYAIHLASKMKQLKLKESVRFDELRKEIKYKMHMKRYGGNNE